MLELSLREAQRLGDNYIGTEHILLGLAREGEGVGAQVLVNLGANLNRVRAEVMQFVRAGEAEPEMLLAGESGRPGRGAGKLAAQNRTRRARHLARRSAWSAPGSSSKASTPGSAR